MQFIPRTFDTTTVKTLIGSGLHPLLAQLYAARGITSAEELDTSFQSLIDPRQLKDNLIAGKLIANAICRQQKICIIADYDCDGATACATAILGLQYLGAKHVDFIVPNRISDGYGLTAALAQKAKDKGAELIITVDNGIASLDGVAAAKALGMTVIITDHHLPFQHNGAVQLPPADAIVNPNQPDCPFPSKNLAGVGVMFYVLLSVRKSLREASIFSAATQPRLDNLLPLVALGTIADVVYLDQNNRVLVAQGLARIQRGDMPPGMQQLFAVCKRSFRQATVDDLSFALAPRINAAGRLADMHIGINCLTSTQLAAATKFAHQLDDINSTRQQLESDMRAQAQTITAELIADGTIPAAPTNLCLYSPSFHEGVVGIVASRLKDKMHCPTFVFAQSRDSEQAGILKGSGRSIYGIHLKDVLDAIQLKHPGILLKFGGHAMAAGCSLAEADFALFRQTFSEIISSLLTTAPNKELVTDGQLAADFLNLPTARLLKQQIWGQGLPAPVFSQPVTILEQRFVGNKQQHSSLKLSLYNTAVDAVWFGQNRQLPQQLNIAFNLDINQWHGNTNLSLRIIDAQN